MEQQSFDRTRLVTALMKVGHGDLDLFIRDGLPAAKGDSDLFGHVTAWNLANGKVKDSKVAFPMIALRGLNKSQTDLTENALSCMASLGPRELLRSYQFSKKMTADGHVIPGGLRRNLEWTLKRYLEVRENDQKWWDSSVVSNRKAMTALYTVAHKKPSDRAQAILFDKKYPKDSVFSVIANLGNLSPLETAGQIVKHRIPMQVAIGSVNKTRDPDFLLALMENMSGNELINSTAMLKRLGVFDNPMLKSSYDGAVERAKSDRKVNTYKVSRAVDAVDGQVAKKLVTIQREQERKLGGIEGNWLVLGDRSLSMRQSIEIARKLAGVLASQVKGDVYLIFFNTVPTLYEVTGKSFDEIENMTKNVGATGCTSIGCGLQYLKDKNIIVNGIAIVSDGGDNTGPYFHQAYEKYCDQVGIEPTVYQLHVPGDLNHLSTLCSGAGIDLEIFELDRDFDYYSLPNVVKSMRTSRYGLLDEIMQTPLLTFNQVFG